MPQRASPPPRLHLSSPPPHTHFYHDGNKTKQYRRYKLRYDATYEGGEQTRCVDPTSVSVSCSHEAAAEKKPCGQQFTARVTKKTTRTETKSISEEFTARLSVGDTDSNETPSWVETPGSTEAAEP